MRSEVHLTLFAGSVFCLFLAFAAETSNGPTAYVSIYDNPQYVTARPCAAECLWYQGVWTCGLNSGYYDLAQELQCGCDALNNCYCGKDNAASASSYISSCVSAGCSKFPEEQKSAIALYNSYCATANVAQASSSTAAAASFTERTTTSTKAASTKPRDHVVQTDSSSAPVSDSGNVAAGATPVITAFTMSLKTSSTTPGATSSGEAAAEKKGLSSSDLIALGVGLGVGIPSLCVALATFCLMRRKANRANRQPTQLLANGPMHRLESY